MLIAGESRFGLKSSSFVIAGLVPATYDRPCNRKIVDAATRAAMTLRG